MKQAKFAYSLLRNAFEKQTKAIEDQGEKQIDTITNRKDNYKEIIWKTSKRKIWWNKRINKWNKPWWFNALF